MMEQHTLGGTCQYYDPKILFPYRKYNTLVMRGWYQVKIYSTKQTEYRFIDVLYLTVHNKAHKHYEGGALFEFYKKKDNNILANNAELIILQISK